MDLEKLYNDPSFPGSFSGKYKFYKEVKKIYPNITLRVISKFLSSTKSYALHKPVRKPRFYRKVMTKGINYLWQADLLVLDKFWRTNRGNRYCCFVIDTFSKKLWTFPLKRKTGTQLTKALTLLFTQHRPQQLQVW